VKLKPEGHGALFCGFFKATAFASYDKIMYDVTLSPAMGHYLDMVNNNKATPGHSPDENYARENPAAIHHRNSISSNIYGRVIKDSTTSAGIPTFDQDTVEGFAAAFTGWTYAPKAGARSRFPNPANWDAPMVPFEANHDMYTKVLLNGTKLPANQTAEQDLKGALAYIFEHSNVAPFIKPPVDSKTGDQQSHQTLMWVGSPMYSTKSRAGDMAAVVEGRSCSIPKLGRADDGAENAATKLREPVLWISALLRGLGATVAPANGLTGAASVLGQTIYYPATVFNYFLPWLRSQLVDKRSRTMRRSSNCSARRPPHPLRIS